MALALPLPKRIVNAWRALRSRDAYYGGAMQGGIVNYQTGMGTSLDKSEQSFFRPTRVYSRQVWEVLRVQSWAARKFIEIPVDDMLIRWREWQGDEGDSAVDAMKEVERRLKVARRVRDAMKAGRLYGTALLCIISREAPLESELMPERIRPGDIVELLVFDRFNVSYWERNYELMGGNYGVPTTYTIHPNRGPQFTIHSSRVLRIDGMGSLTADGFISYDMDWGVSDLIPAMLSVVQDQTVASAAAHLTQVASIPVLEVDGLREAMAGMIGAGEATPQQIGEQVNDLMSVYRLLMLNKGSETFNRVAVTFAGLDKIIDKVERRLCAAADIPITRFYGQSPAGMNATGESDWRNYSTMLDSKREAMMPELMETLDMVLAREAGIQEPPEYKWNSLINASDKEIAEIAKGKAEALKIALDSYAIDEDEMRAALDGDPVFGTLAGEAPGAPDMDIPPMPGNGPQQPPNAA